MTKTFSLPVDAILLLGPTGVGKSPLGDYMARHGLLRRTCRHLDFGSELRGAITRPLSAFYDTAELDFIHSVLERGLLLENEHFSLAEKIICRYLDRIGFVDNDVLVLNGIPRHTGQAFDIAVIATIHAIIVLDCSADDVVCRIRDNRGGDRTDRVDDDREMIVKKLSIFRERTAPLINYYAQQGCCVYRLTVSSDMTPSDTYSKLSLLASANPPITLVAEPPQ